MNRQGIHDSILHLGQQVGVRQVTQNEALITENVCSRSALLDLWHFLHMFLWSRVLIVFRGHYSLIDPLVDSEFR